MQIPQANGNIQTVTFCSNAPAGPDKRILGKCIPALLWFSFSLFEPAALLRLRNFREVCQNSFLAAV